MIIPGKLDQVIEIQSASLTGDGMGADTSSWAAVAGSPKRAEYIPVRGIERIEGSKLESVTLFKLRIRRFSTMSTKYRVVHSGSTYRITGIEDFHREMDMVLHCAEIL
jgi:head-tail adaptor